MRSSAVCWLSLALVLGAAARAEDPSAPAALTLPELMRRMATTAGVAAAFREEKQLALLSAPLTSRGRLYFVPPDRLARFTSSPDVSPAFDRNRSPLCPFRRATRAGRELGLSTLHLGHDRGGLVPEERPGYRRR